MLEMIRNSFARLKDQEGATAVEYGILVAAIAAVIVAVVFTLGTQVKSELKCTSDSMSTGADACSTS